MEKKNIHKEQVRCLNCFERFSPDQGESTATCPKCKVEWRVTWSSPKSVKVRGPVWSSFK